MNLTALSRLTDTALVAQLAGMARGEREASAALVAHLAELYGRGLHERAGYASLFTYCVEVLHFSESEAYDRMKAAKVARRYPAVLKLLASCRVSLTTIRLLAPHLTRENQAELFAEAEGKRTREVQLMLARRFPQGDVRSTVRKLPLSLAAPAASPGAAGAPGRLTAQAPPPVNSVSPPLAAKAAPPVPISAPPPPLMRPLAEDRFRVTFTANADTCAMLELARDLLRHAVPDGDAAVIFSRALGALVDDLVRKKFAATEKPRASRGQAEDSRNIPAEVKRAVYIRDRGRCAYVGRDGHRCGERAFIEFHHVQPHGAGGPATVENVSLRCRVHNQLEAELFYGPHVRHQAVRETSPAQSCQFAHVFVAQRKYGGLPDSHSGPDNGGGAVIAGSELAVLRPTCQTSRVWRPGPCVRPCRPGPRPPAGP